MITVVGTGPMGTALTAALRAAGYGVRQVGARGGTPAGLARARLVIYALPLPAALDTAALLPDGRHRILVDVTNPAFIGQSRPPAGRTAGEPHAGPVAGGPHAGPMAGELLAGRSAGEPYAGSMAGGPHAGRMAGGLHAGPMAGELLAGRSAGELLAERLPSWRVVKAFNTVPAVLVGSPRLGGATVTVPVAGDDPLARRAVRTMAARLGFHAVDAGDITASRAIEGLAALLWRVGRAHGMRDRVGFQVLAG